jgi:peptide/nickel transport system ATP-binding protein/oligopeptide transport system ATP-binding protein
MQRNLLEIKDLNVTFTTDEGTFNAVENVSFHVGRGEIVGLVGESGCGKSVTALSILRLIPSPPGRIERGNIFFKGKDLLQMSSGDMRRFRGRAISMIFQEPVAALSPLHRIGQQMKEVLILHKKISKERAKQISTEWLEKVKIPDAKEKMAAYPHQLSGGMQQRVMIAMALMLDPDLIIADEPTTALDVTVQAQVFELILKMKQKHTSILLITHDMGVIWEMCDRVLVMYAARIAEEANRNDIFSNPAHPYTQGLLKSIPKLSTDGERLKSRMQKKKWLHIPINFPAGCSNG